MAKTHLLFQYAESQEFSNVQVFQSLGLCPFVHIKQWGNYLTSFVLDIKSKETPGT